MLVISALLTLALLLGGPATRRLARAGWASRHPQAALRMWHACALGLLTSLIGALVLAAHDLWEHSMVWLFHADKPLVHAAYGGAWQVRGIADAALLTLLLGVAGLAGAALLRSLRLRRERARHRLTADVQGSCDLNGTYDDDGEGSIRVLTHTAPAAFCIPGTRGRSRIVVTSALRDLLPPTELAATLEHERAHLRMRHHRAILAADVLTTALGRTGLLRAYADEVRRLAELAADDQAAQRHGRRAVASALLELSSAPSATNAGGAARLAMSGPDPAERIRRLISTTQGGESWLSRALAATATAVVPMLPALVALAPAVLLAGTAHLSGGG